MSGSHLPKALNAAIETTPIIDHHAHPLLKREFTGQHPLLAVATEAHGAALEATGTSLAHLRAVRQLAGLLRCEPTWEAVSAAVAGKRASATAHERWVRRCLEGIETILVDDGLDRPGQVEGYDWHSGFTGAAAVGGCRRIVRIEAVAEDIIARQCASLGPGGGDRPPGDWIEEMKAFADAFQDAVAASVRDPAVAGFKSVVCYRGGLALPGTPESTSMRAVQAAYDSILDGHGNGERPFAGKNRRLQHPPLNHFVVHVTAMAIRAASGPGPKKPLQFHTGLGDNDILLTTASPAHLQPFVRQYPEVPVVILHAGYPWTREAGYLAAMYGNVYADVGEVFPFVARHGQEAVLRQMLELCPWSKILWSTDGHWFPETYLLATVQVREVLKTVLGDLVLAEQLTEPQAVELVQAILFSNARRLYGLSHITRSLPTYAQLSAGHPSRSRPSSPHHLASPATPLAKLRALDAKYLRLYWHDYTGSARCRVLPVARAHRALEAGQPLTLNLARATFGLLPNDALLPSLDATGMYTAVADLGAVRAGPAPGHASAPLDFHGEDDPLGPAAPLCPRGLLRRLAARAQAAAGLRFLVGFELEFVLLGPNPGYPSRSPEKYAALHRDDGHAWSMARSLAGWRFLLDEVLDALGADAVEQVHAEAAPGQYELVLAPLPPLAAVDALLHARQVLETMAASRGLRATVHPKPVAGAMGTACHAHISLLSSSSGVPVRDPAGYEPFYAGVLAHLRALLALTYASPASYARAVDGAWAGGRWVCWGAQNKEAPLRRCCRARDAAGSSHWELKALDGMANPYLAIAGVLAAGLDGIQRGTPLRWKDCAGDPAKMSPAERAGLGIDEMFPADLHEALEALAADQVLVEALGPELVQRYREVKTAELAMLDPMEPEERRRWLIERY
ncbi:glutamine synthetase/guanido kinase [Xylariomycetidae sp. FL0641]|nr:glutamine synthetase/guanido kinase [Xylariomycetidae sp. FL0641]